MRKKIEYQINVFQIRIKSLRIDLKVLFVIATISIILIEFIFLNIIAKYEFQVILGQIYLKICYSFLSAFLFYYIIVFLPRERKRQKSYNFIGYKILDISMYIEDIFFKIYNVNDFPTKISTLNITRDTLKVKCQLVNPSLPVRSRFNNIVKFQNFDKFLDYSAQKIEPLTRDIIMLDLLDDSCFENIILINKTITFSWFLEISSDFPLHKTLEGYTDTLYTLFEQNESLKANFLLYGRFYEFEFHHNARKNEFKRRARDKQLHDERMRAQSGS